ncbi:hypothetical protein [Rugosimonospora africana]|uniref:Uncharacterized protein n=1 Tax=Rugosimonospora africana TaxID=556532 RepID=A0A8J3R1X4_9ACTN|nr:hypothetical protein [Rugosimonospora africana]GIH21480.1 hypothetical protein Raf01_96520 [Rugosimonospora africana]
MTGPALLVVVPATPPAADTARVLDWRGVSSVGPLRPCRICRQPAMMRDPDGRPCHKVCAEQHEYERWHARTDLPHQHRTHRLAA